MRHELEPFALRFSSRYQSPGSTTSSASSPRVDQPSFHPVIKVRAVPQEKYGYAFADLEFSSRYQSPGSTTLNRLAQAARYQFSSRYQSPGSTTNINAAQFFRYRFHPVIKVRAVPQRADRFNKIFSA